ncbi:MULTISPECIES: hypothetical protein [unclassified Brenneria]|uniref:hypothetical protein n=1 Tax=unclassified Brenneria TaxID=2634434 RepID=UPI0029C5C488|nr:MULTISPECIES: hypothetical protein [unclassified Brenneria]MDX5631106.1 hypothetical protein [Brenneria sp. L3-3Z]MDX5698179.1 hypothetical protein [Brenneria sp. L4-2C]
MEKNIQSMWWKMNIIDNDFLKEKRSELHSKFSIFSDAFLSEYKASEKKVCMWEYSLGISRDVIPYERLVPSIIQTNGKILKKPTKSNFESKNLVSYGLDDNGNVILSKKKYDKDVEKYGENIRIVEGKDGRTFILNGRIYISSPEKNKLLSLCYSYEEEGSVYYISITPPNDWFVRVDSVSDGKIKKSSMFATSWFKQIDYDFIYDNSDYLSKIMIGDVVHWERKL